MACICLLTVCAVIEAAVSYPTSSSQETHYERQLHSWNATLRTYDDMPNITLVSHATLDRLPHVARWCRTWRGPMSISIFVRPVVDDVERVMGAFAADECIARHADLHLVRERAHRYDAAVAASGSGGKDMMTHYPFNVQRNAALDGCVGDLAFLMDIDFHLMPVGENHEEALRRHLAAQRAKVAAWPFLADEPWVSDAAVYVVPAVETVLESIPMPETMDALRSMVNGHAVCGFYGHHCRHCHGPTNLGKFLKAAEEPFLVDYEEGYEPYVIVNKSSVMGEEGFTLPRYEKVFIGRGKDKLSYFFEIAEQRRPFVVLAGPYFVVHPGRGAHPLDPGEGYRVRFHESTQFYDAFKKDVRTWYGRERKYRRRSSQDPHHAASLFVEYHRPVGRIGYDHELVGEGVSRASVGDEVITNPIHVRDAEGNSEL